MVEVTLPIATGTNGYKKFTIADSGFDCGPCDIFTFYVDINQMKKNQIPIEANVRNPALNTKATRAMAKTLTDVKERKRMWAYNGGLIVICEKAVHTSSGTIKLTIPPEYGLVNGGHTQMAICKALVKEAGPGSFVRVEALKGTFTNTEIARIARARNTSKGVGLTSLLNKEGVFSELKNDLGTYSPLIEWKDNEVSGPSLDASKLIYTMMMMDGKTNPKGKIPSGLSGSVTTVVENWAEDPEGLDYLGKVSRDILKLRDAILSELCYKRNEDGTRGARRHEAFLLTYKGGGKAVFKFKKLGPSSYKKHTTVFTKKEYDVVPDEAFLYPILCAFRVLMEVKPMNKTIQWRKDPVEIWQLQEVHDYIWDKIKNPAISGANKANDVRTNKTLVELIENKIDSASKSSKKANKKVTVGSVITWG